MLTTVQILGFAPSGDAILPANSTSADAEMIRREKLGWEEISVQAAKIISFIGKLSPDIVVRRASLMTRKIWLDTRSI